MSTHKGKSKGKSTKGSSASSRGGPFGAFTEADFNLTSIHDQSSSEVIKALSKPSMQPFAKPKETREERKLRHAKARKAKEERSPTEKKLRDQERLLRKVAKEELEQAKKLGIMNLIEVPKALKKEFTERLHQEHEDLFKFIITTIAPLNLAIDSATADAVEAMKIMTGLQDVDISFARIDKVFQEMADIKTISYLAKKLKLSRELQKVLIEKHFGSQAPKDKSSAQDALRQLLASRQEQKPITNRTPIKHVSKKQVVTPVATAVKTTKG